MPLTTLSLVKIPSVNGSTLLTVKHISGKINPLDVFTKEMRDAIHFRWLNNSFMLWLSDFVNASLLAIRHTCQAAASSVPAASLAVLAAGPLSHFTALASYSFCQSLPAISHLSSAGHQRLRSLHGFFPRVSYSTGFYRRFGFIRFFPDLWFPVRTLFGNPLGFWCGAFFSWTYWWGVFSLSLILE